jgi:hypothetical protein
MTKPPRQQPDGADRALRAARECRAAVREAHEVIQGMREATRELNDAHQALKDYVADLVPGEVKRQLDKLEPATRAAMDASVAKVTAEFDRLEALLLGKEKGGPSLVAVAEAYAAARAQQEQGECPREEMCPHCGATSLPHHARRYQPVGRPDGSDKPGRGDASVCAQCAETSVFDLDVAGNLILRKPSLAESKELARSRAVRQATARIRRTAGGET